MFDITEKDVLTVYQQLKDKYDLILTTTAELDDGFTIDVPIIVGKAHGQIIQLYACESLFVMDVLNADQTMCTHWHPYDVDMAVNDISEFMDGKSDYQLEKIPQA